MKVTIRPSGILFATVLFLFTPHYAFTFLGVALVVWGVIEDFRKKGGDSSG